MNRNGTTAARLVRGRGDDRAVDLGGRVRGRLEPVLALALVALDVLEHDDGVVDQHADAEREPAQRHQVERQPAERHDDEGDHDRDRDRAADDQRAAHAAEERVDHQHRQHRAGERRGRRVVERLAHVDGLVGDLVDLHVLRHQPALVAVRRAAH